MINEKILGMINKEDSAKVESNNDNKDEAPVSNSNAVESETDSVIAPGKGIQPAHKGSLLMDATASPQDIAYPTDLNLLNVAREKSEELIDELQANLSTAKPRTYRELARKKYLRTAQKKKKTRKEIRLQSGNNYSI